MSDTLKNARVLVLGGSSGIGLATAAAAAEAGASATIMRAPSCSVDALRDLGYTVMEAADARQAITQLAVQPRVDLLFTDIVMPEMNGRQLADKARELRPNLKVVFTTGYTRNALVHHGALDPGVSLLPKPFTVSELVTTIRDTLDDRGSSRSAVAPTG